MDAFLGWFFEFISKMLDGFILIFGGLFKGIATIFNVFEYGKIFSKYTAEFGIFGWILAVLSVLVVLAVWVILGYLIYLVIKRRIKIGKTIASQENLFEQIADLHRETVRLTDEKDRILALKMSEGGVSAKALAEAITDINVQMLKKLAEAGRITAEATAAAAEEAEAQKARFQHLSEIDQKYVYYLPPEYSVDVSLMQICEALRNFACSQRHLYYEPKVIRTMIAGMASTKLIILQGISGTGKTSLPHCMGKFLTVDATIASVQPSWRDRTELFGYFNEFTKRFNETDVLERIYEASFNDDINLIILDEMNIARVEYYFAEMLSILEMPDQSEWKLALVPNSWPNDPKNLEGGNLRIPPNLWYIGTANNDDSTFSVSDKVYDRAMTITLDAKGAEFEAPMTEPMHLSAGYLQSLYDQAIKDHPVSQEMMDKINKLDVFIISKLRVAFGNRIINQLKIFVPVYVACGGTELDAVDFVLATKVFRKFESLNLSLLREEFKELLLYLTKTFGKNSMQECRAYIEYLQKLY